MAQITLNSTGVASNGALVLQSNGTTAAVTVDTSQNVGVGVAPSVKLDIVGTASQITNGAGASGSRIRLDTPASSGGSYIQIYKDLTPSYVAGIGTVLPGGSAASALVFSDYQGSWVERMRLDASGNLGIGSTSPIAKLDISGISTSQNGLRLTATSGGQALAAFTADTSTGEIRIGGTVAAAGNYFPVFYAAGSERARIDSSGNLLVGTTSSSSKFRVYLNSSAEGNGSTANFTQDGTGDAAISFLIGATTEWLAGVDNSDSDKFKINAITGGSNFNNTGLNITTGGDVSISGSLSKGSGSFRIDHPLPQLTETHQLVHSFVEAPKADLIYRGKVNLVNGTATVNIDAAATMTEGTFVALCRDVQCFTTNESGWNHVRGSVTGNTLTIECQDQTASDLISWMVIGERKDKHMIDTDWTDDNGKVIVEPLKEQSSTTLEGA